MMCVDGRDTAGATGAKKPMREKPEKPTGLVFLCYLRFLLFNRISCFPLSAATRQLVRTRSLRIGPWKSGNRRKCEFEQKETKVTKGKSQASAVIRDCQQWHRLRADSVRIPPIV
jgi:hypothetical protein